MYGKPGNYGQNSTGTVQPGRNFPQKKVIPFKVLPFARFYRNDRNFLHHMFGLPVPGFMSREKRKIYLCFVNGTTQSRSCFRCQKIPVPFDGNFSTKFVASSPSFSRPAPRAPQRACLQAKHRHVECARAILNALV